VSVHGLVRLASARSLSPSAEVLGFFPQWLAGVPEDWPKQLKLVGFPLAERSVDESALEPALRSFLATARETSEPVFAFAAGSAPPPYASKYFETAVEACRQLGAKAVILCTVESLVPKPLPEHCYHASFASFSALLQHVAVFCFNGGIGGASEALRAGTPQVRAALQRCAPLEAS
jgi:UDP:flavonoid glycosyltransferase YjiC (YdhE family)